MQNNNVTGGTAPAPQVQPTSNAAGLKKFQEETVDKIQEQISLLQEAGDLRLPKEYAVGNQLKLAWLNLLTVEDRNGKKALDVCTKESICNAMLKMCVMGLSVSKKQCDFIVYGNQLICQQEYHGTIALARRLGGVVGVPTGNVIYEGDEFVYTINPTTGRKEIVKHNQELKNIDMNKIAGAYATLQLNDGSTHVEIMNMTQIRQAWMQGPMKGQSPAHKNFPDQMAIKTVISRGCKLFISSSDDAALFSEDDEKEPISSEDQKPGAARTERKKLSIDNAEDAQVLPPETTKTNTEKENAFEQKNNAPAPQGQAPVQSEMPEWGKQ
jgi:recombination protein RecT